MALLVFVYVAIRTFTVGLANDEAATFFTFVHTGDFIPFVSDYWSANNHFVNTALTWVCYQLFGVTEWVIRLPNLLALGVFMYFIFRIGKRLEHRYLRWFFWIALLSCHYLIEFFGYSRGYGLSIAFLMGSIHYLLLAQEDAGRRYRNLLLGLVMISLGLFSNLNLIVSYLIWLALAQVVILKNFHWKKFLGFNLLAMVPLALAVVISLILKSKEELYIGQSSLRKTFHTLLGRFAGMNSDLALNIFLVFLALLLLAALVLTIRRQFRKIDITPLLLLVALFGLNLLAVQLMYWWLDVLLPTERTAMHWFPLFTGLTVFTLDRFHGWPQKAMGIISAAILLAVPVYGLRSANLKVSADPLWAMEQIPDDFYFAVVNDSPADEFPRSISSSTSFYTFTWAFKNLKFQQGQDACVDFKFWDPQYIADYLILNLNEFDDFTEIYDTLLYDVPTRMTLLKRKNLLQKKKAGTADTRLSQQQNDEWVLIGEWPVDDSLYGKSIRLDYTLLIHSPVHPIPSLVTLEIRDSLSHTLHYDQFRVNYFKTNFGNDEPIRASLLLDSVPDGASTLRTLYWNIKSEPFTLNSSRVDFYQLVEN